jgi:MFS transporter, DHA2 family, methylenomycin A resistance protein
MIFLLPLVWRASGLLGSETAGLALLPCALVSQRSRHLAQRIGVRAMTAGGTAVIGCGLLVLAATRAGQPLALAAVGLADGYRHGPEPVR